MVELEGDLVFISWWSGFPSGLSSRPPSLPPLRHSLPQALEALVTYLGGKRNDITVACKRSRDSKAVQGIRMLLADVLL